MSQLLALIDAYKDTHGSPSDASIARAVGIAPQTLSSWRKRGIRELPQPDTLASLAGLLGVPHEEYLLQVALYDSGWRKTMPTLPEHKEGGAAG